MLIAPSTLWSDGRLHRGLAVELQGSRIVDVRPLRDETPDLQPSLMMPSLTDLQVNGGGGVMINGDPTPDGFRAVAAAHRGLGTGAILPTVITDAPQVMEEAAQAAIAVKGEPGQLGLHIEGPHINEERRGTHDARYIRPLDDRTLAVVEALRAADVPVKLTLAPETVDLDQISRLAGLGVIVSGGHSMATAEETGAALKAGLGCFTHLYNAMPPMTSRAPGILGAALVSTAFAGIIVDGIHCDWDMVRIALRARPRKGLTFAVSDAMATVGGPDSFTLYGQEITVRDGRLVNAQGSLAGAHIDMATSLANLVRHVDLPLEEAIAMVTDVPRSLLGLPRQTIETGSSLGDLVAFDDHWNRMELA